jgi:hypothetical protein
MLLPTEAPVKKTATPKKKRVWLRRVGIAAGGGAVVALGLGIAVHASPAFGAKLADGARAVLGQAAVAWLEDTVYGFEDSVKGLVYKDAPPKTLWEPQTAAPAPPPPPTAVSSASASPSGSPAVAPPAFPPGDFSPPEEKVAGAGDGHWIAMPDPSAPTDAPLFYKALVHPDKKRSYSAVAVVALDLSRINITLVAGTIEPASPSVHREDRPGVVPKDKLDDLVAAFNGGFKAEHGHWGMMIGGQQFLPPRDIACTVALFKNGTIDVRTWPALKDKADEMLAWRQAPPCLVEEDSVNDKLVAFDETKGWGAAVGGNTVIRRSALGLDKDHKILFYGLGESVTAGALARAMHAAGAQNAAQLDVNAAYPRFLMFAHPGGTELPYVANAVIPDIQFSRHEYVGEPVGRDFFYVTRKPRPS